MDGSDETDFTLQKDYLLAHSDHGKFYMVDEGWYNHSQQMLTEMLNIETFGYYIGSCRKEKLPYDDRCHRKGLLFEMRDDNKTLSPFLVYFVLIEVCMNNCFLLLMAVLESINL